MLELLIIIYIIWFIVKKRRRNNTSDTTRRKSAYNKKRFSDVSTRMKKAASAIPNVPKQFQRNKEEQEMAVRTQTSKRACNYEASYSKGRPDRVGKRGDYDPVTPGGMIRVRCSYCNAENFVPAGTHTHYHCYFCWEKL